ncbi:hypothetical protein L596_013467 [Steinernema carpocapsae]|uniref:Serpin domain-containing protein n=1 Tax=Steinernema carpocapsae TaxID=34508 RepID=A0A4U5P083_STECR|nr:hypothetical protein L596_013467 [Steinernema carpocapsae]
MLTSSPPPKKTNIPINYPDNNYDFTDAFFKLAVNLLNTKSNPPRCSVVSPFSICLALAVAAGAREKTQKQILEVIFEDADLEFVNEFFKDTLRGLTDISIGSVIYVDKTCHLQEEYQNQLIEHYDTFLKTSDFANNPEKERKKINAYVRVKTKNFIRELISPGAIHGGTRLVLANAIYLTAQFDNIFSEHATKDREFCNEDGTTKKVPTMEGSIEHTSTSTDPKQRFCSTESFDYIDFYVGKERQFEFFILLPKNQTCARLKTALLQESSLLFSQIHQKAEPIFKICLQMPKFRTDASFDLKAFLSKAGVTDAFAGSADFSGMTNEKVQIDFFGHKATFDINEKGLSAAAATYFTMVKIKQDQRKPFVMKANRPFLYGVCQSGLPLFVGQYY